MKTFRRSKHGIACLELLETCTVKRSQPLNITNKDLPLFNQEFLRRLDSCHVLRISGLSIAGPNWIQWRYARLADQYQPWQGEKRQKKLRLVSLLQLLKTPIRVQNAIWVHDNWSEGYFHWFTDVCPKIIAWISQGMPMYPILLPSSYLTHSYIVDSLRALNLPWLSFKSTDHLHVENLYVVGAVAPSGNYRPDLQRAVAKRVLEFHSVDRQSPQPSLSVWISRKDASRRRLVNEIEVLDFLPKGTFLNVCLAKKSLIEQIRIFSRTRLIVSVHGNGLTNMLWMPPGGSIIEIRRRGDCTNNCYYSLAQALGQKYYYIEADDITGRNDTHLAELTLSPSHFKELLDFVRLDRSGP